MNGGGDRNDSFIIKSGGVHTNRKKKSILLILLLLLAVGGGIVWWCLPPDVPVTFPNFDPNATEWQGDQELDKERVDSDSIRLPCMEKLVFMAGETEQRVNLYNPEENTCYMIISLELENETLWESGLVEPGKGFYTIELNRALDVGKYNANIRYQCFSQNDLSELNGAEVAFNLTVQ
ncbi:MAG: hypothetical protein Q4P20_12240 [Eubacteriales bacterium]|nr:hypothetical protein [Eubacteriales bacterium]